MLRCAMYLSLGCLNGATRLARSTVTVAAPSYVAAIRMKTTAALPTVAQSASKMQKALTNNALNNFGVILILHCCNEILKRR